MGSLLGGIGGASLGVAGGPLGMAAGAMGGSYLGNKVGGPGSLSDMLGIKDNYQAQNPYSQEYLQGMVNNQGQIYGDQQTLAQALQQQMAGQGPNPAQTMFQGNQQSNIANAQGLIASQRGLNPALAARMGANAAAQGNQQAALGSALLQQQQQLGATSNLGNLYGQMQQGNLGQQQLYNQANLGANQVNAGVSAGNTNRNTQLIGGLMGGIGSAGAAMAAAHGGRIPGKPADGPDSKANDNVPIMAQAGEIIIPNSKSHDPEKAKEFIDHLLKGRKKGGGYGDVVAARRKSKEK